MRETHIIVVTVALVGLFSIGTWSGMTIARFIPNRSGFIPLFFFDSTEPYLPSAINFDNTWNTAGSEDAYKTLNYRNLQLLGEAPIVLYTKTTVKDNYMVFHYFPWYASNAYINYHEIDPEQGAKVWVRDNKPFIFAINAHGKWDAFQVSRVEDLYVYVQRGSHGLFKNVWSAYPCDAQLRLTPDNFTLIDVSEAAAHKDEFLDSENRFLISKPGDYTRFWDSYPWFDDPDVILENKPELQALLVGRGSVPLSVIGSFPSATSLVVNGSLLALIGFVLAFSFRENGWACFSVVSLLAVIGLIVGSFLTYAPEQLPFSAAVVGIRAIPFAFLFIASLSIGLFVRITVEAIGGRR